MIAFNSTELTKSCLEGTFSHTCGGLSREWDWSCQFSFLYLHLWFELLISVIALSLWDRLCPANPCCALVMLPCLILQWQVVSHLPAAISAAAEQSEQCEPLWFTSHCIPAELVAVNMSSWMGMVAAERQVRSSRPIPAAGAVTCRSGALTRANSHMGLRQMPLRGSLPMYFQQTQLNASEKSSAHSVLKMAR